MTSRKRGVFFPAGDQPPQRRSGADLRPDAQGRQRLRARPSPAAARGRRRARPFASVASGTWTSSCRSPAASSRRTCPSRPPRSCSTSCRAPSWATQRRWSSARQKWATGGSGTSFSLKLRCRPRLDRPVDGAGRAPSRRRAPRPDAIAGARSARRPALAAAVRRGAYRPTTTSPTLLTISDWATSQRAGLRTKSLL